MARTKYFLKLKCDSSKLTAETLLPGVDEMAVQEISELIDSESEFHKDLLILQSGVYSPNVFTDAISKISEIETELSEGRAFQAREALRDLLNIVVSGSIEYVPILESTGTVCAIEILKVLNAIKHLSIPKTHLSSLDLVDITDIAFLDSSSGDLHMNQSFYSLISEIGSIDAKGSSVSGNCVIIDLETFVSWAKENSNIDL